MAGDGRDGLVHYLISGAALEERKSRSCRAECKVHADKASKRNPGGLPMISEVGGVAQVTSCDDSACDSHVTVRPCGAEHVVAGVREPKTKESEGFPSVEPNVHRRACAGMLPA